MSISTSNYQLTWNYPAVINNVDIVCSAVVRILEKYKLNNKDKFAVLLLLREALNNAVIQGCKQNPLMTFSCNLEISNLQAVIEVSDEGLGFDWRARINAPSESADETGRGLFIYTVYANSIIFNDPGNCVTLTRIFNQGENHD